jgi:hypothetical protein
MKFSKTNWISTVAALSAAVIVLSLAVPAFAAGPRRGLSVFGALGFNGEADADEVEAAGATGSVSSDDVEDMLGAGAIYEVNPGIRNVAVGGRVFALTGTLEDSDDELLSVDGGVWGRYYQPVADNLLVFGAGP